MSTEPMWLSELVDRVCACIEHLNQEAPIGCHYFQDADCWEITLFTVITEIVGGPEDGRWIPEPVVFNVSAILKAFDEVWSVSWQAGQVSSDDELGTHLSIQGCADGREVWLRLLEQAPSKFSPGQIRHHASGRVARGW